LAQQANTEPSSVTAAQASISRFKKVFKPDAGMTKAKFNVGAEYSLTKNWQIT
jgi:outer membrane scaffolding protein for murein synthesis (MipA/OmpV family)